MPPESVFFHRIVAGCGLFVMVFIAWLMSSYKRRFPWRVVIGGMLLQVALMLFIRQTTWGQDALDTADAAFKALMGFVEGGCKLVFGDGFAEHYFVFRVLPSIVFFSSLMAVLYHLRIMQAIVTMLAFVLRYTLGTSGAESLAAAANIFVGQTEAPFVVRPYIPKMTLSELMAMMTGGFSTVAGGVLIMYIGYGIDAGHLLAASVISAPASLLIAKVMIPETEESETSGSRVALAPTESTNLVEAATHGASEGLKLALNVAAMLIAFMGLIALLDFLLSHGSLWVMNRLFGMGVSEGMTLSTIFGWCFSPLAWLMGIEWKECFDAGQLLGLKVAANEVLAYAELGQWIADKTGEMPQLSRRTITILTYALCGFSNFASIGIQVGGIGGLCPERRPELARLGLRAMFGGMLACCMTACVAGIVIE